MNTRSVNLDLLRILAMVMVVCLHYCNHGGLVEGTLIPGTLNWIAGNLVFALAFVSVNCFVLISGYFQCTSRYKASRHLSMWVQSLFYSVVLCLLINGIVFQEPLGYTIKELVKSSMVVTLSQYWFVTAYFLLYAVSPFLNCAIRAMSREMHRMCCIVLFVIFSVCHNIVYINDFGKVNGGSSFLWFCVLYVIAAYIRLHVEFGKLKPTVLVGGYLSLCILIAVERILAYYITPAIFGRVVLNSLFFSYNSILTAIASVCLFCFFREITISGEKVSWIISKVAPLAFGVYLIHDNRFVRPILWEAIKPYAYAESPYLLLHMVLCVTGIFVLCCGIEWIRKSLFDRLKISRKLTAIGDAIQKRITQCLNLEGEKHD